MTKNDERPPETLVGISFPDIFRAQEFVTAATRMAARGELHLKDAVTVVKNADGKTVVHETIDPQPIPTAVSGALWAGLFGLLLGGPVGWVAGLAVGAGAGVATAKIVDLGLADEWVAWFREVVQPDTATVALLVTELNRNALVTEVERFSGANLVYTNLDPTTMDRLEAALHQGGPARNDAASDAVASDTVATDAVASGATAQDGGVGAAPVPPPVV